MAVSAAPADPSPVPSRAVAAALMLGASAFIAGATVCAKLAATGALGPPLHPLQVTQARFGFASLALLLAVAALRPRFSAPAWPLHLGRTACGGIGVTLMFAAAAAIPLADATAISFLNPVFAMLFAIAILGERVGPWRWAAAAVALMGAAILLRPGPGTLQAGALLALGSAAVIGFEIILIKRLSGRERPLQILAINNAIGVALFSAAAWPVWQAPTAGQWAALAGTGLSMVVAQACIVNALARADASFAVPFTYATLVFAAVYDRVLFGVVPDAVSLTGAATILAGAALLAWRESRAGRPRVGLHRPGP